MQTNDLTLSVGWVGNLEVALGGMSVTEIQNETRILHWSPLGADYMSWVGPVSRAGSVYRDDCSARYYMRRASPPAAKFRSCRVKRWLHQRA